jgi:hypothetical protein
VPTWRILWDWCKERARLRHVKVRDEAIVRRAESRDLIMAGWAAGLTGQAALKEAHRGRRR